MGRSEEEKRCFWEELDSLVRRIPGDERFIVGGDFNGHIGQSSDGYDSVHGGFGFGAKMIVGLLCWSSQWLSVVSL